MTGKYPGPGNWILFAGLMLLAAGCGTRQGVYKADDPSRTFKKFTNAAPESTFVAEQLAEDQKYASDEAVRAFSSGVEKTYRLGPGDSFEFIVRGRPDVSVREVIVSPDGNVALPRVGIIHVAGLSMDAATSNITDRLHRYYESPEVTLVMKTYNNNKVYVLGRVANPGVVHFHGPGTLLEALSLAGGLPVDTARSFLSRCMIVRGDDLIIWVDLQELLDNGNMALNARLKNGDVIYIPQSMDQIAYVMGQVNAPGVLQLRSKMTLLDAVMYSGGPTEEARLNKVYLVRATSEKQGAVEEIDLKQVMAKADFRKNYVLKDGDIVYIPRTGMGKFNHVIRQLLPSLAILDFTIDAAESFGAMQAFRNEVWGQEGFVNGGQ